jgi:hypothetical protein
MQRNQIHLIYYYYFQIEIKTIHENLKKKILNLKLHFKKTPFSKY